MEIRPLRRDEHAQWLTLREQLWPDFTRDELSREQAEILADSRRNCVLVAAADGELIGFAEVSIRDWAEGCGTRPVGYIEAWYVKLAHRCQGVGRRLVETAEQVGDFSRVQRDGVGCGPGKHSQPFRPPGPGLRRGGPNCAVQQAAGATCWREPPRRRVTVRRALGGRPGEPRRFLGSTHRNCHAPPRSRRREH